MNRSKARAGGDLLFNQLHNAQKHIDNKKEAARKQKEVEEVRRNEERSES